MRQIGSLTDEAQAKRFVDYLTTKEISALCDADGDDWVIWVRDENQLDAAKDDLQQFRVDPENASYRDVGRQAAEIRSKELDRRLRAKKNVVEVRQAWNAGLTKRAPVVAAMIVICVGLAILGDFGKPANSVQRWLMFSSSADSWRDIRSGQVWRLLTPIFLHGGVLHLLFNMAWMYHLGGQIEPKLRSLRFAAMVIAIGVASNIMQVELVGPNFLGMSGVVFGLFGYMWVRLRLDPTCGFLLSQQTVLLVMIFFVWGFSMSGIANWAHAGGLMAGALFAYLPELKEGGR